MKIKIFRILNSSFTREGENMVKIRCIETGRGSKGSIFVCWTPRGDVILRARRTGTYKYEVFSEHPYGKYKTVMYAPNRRELRKRIEEWLEFLLSE